MADMTAADVSYTIEFDGEVRNPINSARPVGEYIRELIVLVKIACQTATRADYPTGGIPLSGVLTNALLGINIERIISITAEPLHKIVTATNVDVPFPQIPAYVDVANAKLMVGELIIDDTVDVVITEMSNVDLDAIYFTVGATEVLCTRLHILAHEPYPS